MSSNHLPPVELFTTSILSNHKVRSRHERYTSVLAVKKIPFVYHDLASDEDAKSRWRRKAKDPQIPGLLVHNEWRGTFEEFEESVEFGELNLFLNIDPSRSLPPVPTASTQIPHESKSTSPTSDSPAPSQPAAKLKPMPTAMPQMAPAGTGKRQETAEDLMASLSVDLDSFDLSESDVSTLLEEIEAEAEANRSSRSIKSEGLTGEIAGKNETKSQASRKIGLGQPPPRTYIPSADAGVKPLRFARMGSGNMEPQSMSDRASSINLTRSPSAAETSMSPTSSSSPLHRSSSILSSSNADARYSSSSRSARALAAEASALASSRNFSSKSFKESIKSGQDLQNALRSASTSKNDNEHVVGKETAEDLLASLGLGDLDLTEEEAEKFLLDGEVPEGLSESGSRLKESKKVLTKADRAREEVAAREVAQRARDRGHLPRDSNSSRASTLTTGSSKTRASVEQEENSAPQDVMPIETDAGEQKGAHEDQQADDRGEAPEDPNIDVPASDSQDSSKLQSTEEIATNSGSHDTVAETIETADALSSNEQIIPSIPTTTPTPLSTTPSIFASSKVGPEATSDLEHVPDVSAAVQVIPESGVTDTGADVVVAEGVSTSISGTSSPENAQQQETNTERELEGVKADASTREQLTRTEPADADEEAVLKTLEFSAPSQKDPSIEAQASQSLEKQPVEVEEVNPEQVQTAPESQVASEMHTAAFESAKTSDRLEESTPRGLKAELESESQTTPASSGSSSGALPSNTSPSSLSSSRKGSLSAVRTDISSSSSSGSDRLASSTSPHSPSNAPPVSPSASKALAVSTSSSSLSSGERRKRSGSGAGVSGPTTPTSGRRALDFRRSEAPGSGPSSPSSALSPSSGSGRRSNAASPPPMPPLSRSLSQMSKSESNGSSISIDNNSTSPSSYTCVSPPISPAPGPDGKPLKKKRSLSLSRFGKKDKDTKEREKEEKEEKRRAKKEKAAQGQQASTASFVPSPRDAIGKPGGHQRSISEILREADAAMNGELDLEDDLELNAGGSGEEEEPDDGLGPAEIQDDEELLVRS